MHLQSLVMMRRRELLSYTKTAVTRNQGEKKINSLLDSVSASSDMRLLQVYCRSRSCVGAMYGASAYPTAVLHRAEWELSIPLTS